MWRRQQQLLRGLAGRRALRPPQTTGRTASARRSPPGTSSITDAGQGIRDNPTEDGIKTAGDDIRSATDTLADDLKGLGRPDTESGQEAKAAIDELATSLETSMQKITDAIDNASGASGLVTAGSTIATTLTEMGSQVSTTGQQLENIDAGGELQSAFEQADSCAGLTTTT